nr:ARID DNA-binding domain-containing protein [Tanacetum cinerariifolium]
MPISLQVCVSIHHVLVLCRQVFGIVFAEVKWKGHVYKACPAKAKEEANQSQGHIIGFTEGSRVEENIKRNKGVHYAPEITLNILSMNLLKQQGFEIKFEEDRCTLEYVFKDQHGQNLDVNIMRKRHNEYLDDYFESLDSERTERKEEVPRFVKDTNPLEVQSFNEFVAFLNLIKDDDVISRGWDTFRGRFDKVLKWLFNHYLETQIPGPIPPIVQGVPIHLFDLYKLIDCMGGYLSVHFGHEFGAIAEILGLKRSDGEEIRMCYLTYFDVFISYYKTAMAPIPIKMEEHNESLKSYKWTCATDAEKKGKETLEHFGIKLEEEDEVCKNQQEAYYEKDRTHITCYKCKDLGHYAMDCPRKIKNKDTARITSNKASTSKHSKNKDTYSDLMKTRVCNQYGKVIDAFIPNRRTKSSKRFGFVRFIKQPNKAEKNVVSVIRNKDSKSNGHTNSYIHAVKMGTQFHNIEDDNKPAIVLDESRLNQKDYSTAVMGKVKEFKVSGWVPDFVEDEEEDSDSEYGSIEEGPYSENVDKQEEGNSETDPFNIYGLLNKKRKNLNDNPKSNDTMKYPPGFTPLTNADSQSNDLKGVGKEGDETLKNDQEEKQNSKASPKRPKKIGLRSYVLQTSPSVGYSGGILCVWDSRLFLKVNSMISDYFVMIRGEWISNGLEKVPSGGCSFVWCHKSANKMSKLYRFLISEEKIRAWIKIKKENSYIQKKNLKADLAEIDLLLDKGDENSKYYHGILNKKRSHLAVRGILVNSTWIDSPCLVKNRFLSHFKSRFDQPGVSSLHLNIEFHNKLTMDQKTDLECDITRDEIKRAVWDCGIDKSPGLDGFSFGFYRQYWNLLKKDVEQVVRYFFSMGLFLKAVDFEKAYDSVRWDYLDNILNNFGFGDKWRGWIQNCLKSSRGSIIVNGSTMNEFQFCRDDTVFMVQWSDSNIETIVHVLECFHRASSLRINMNKSEIMGISVTKSIMEQAATKIGCAILTVPFSYLGSKVGDLMSRSKALNDIINKLTAKLSKWKMKML